MENSKTSMKAAVLTKIGICIALLCVSAYISIPIPFSTAPITAQTVIINLIAIILLPKEAFFAITGYLIAGVLMSYILKNMENKIRNYLLVTLLVGIPVIYLCGTLTMRLYVGNGLLTILSTSVIPFLPGDIGKCIVGSYLVYTLKKRLK